jgi:hypothetical protein
MMNHHELREAIFGTVDLGHNAWSLWRQALSREHNAPHHEQEVHEAFLAERYRLAGLLWAAMGWSDEHSQLMFSAATEMARRAVTGEISAAELWNELEAYR